ncbi:unnamed protein product [Triticum turgidum subsp. durum]|uniref:MADS-box transcription factor n=1 Tax=Triticum turgidum subsp. durum TaxID=4567 RepID=A0A9R0Y3H2_TRITD|nr:unnamed protein product [Triticum turgidum subsp. durum]
MENCYSRQNEVWEINGYSLLCSFNYQFNTYQVIGSQTQLMMEQVEELRRKERQLGDINRQLKHKLDAEGSNSNNYRAMQQITWAAGTVVDEGAAAYHMQQQQQQHPNHSAAMDCEPTLQIGYPHQFAAPDQAANNIPRSSAPGGENNFMLGWVL